MGSRIIRYVRDGRIDGQTDGGTKPTLIAFPYGDWGITTTAKRYVSFAQKQHHKHNAAVAAAAAWRLQQHAE